MHSKVSLSQVQAASHFRFRTVPKQWLRLSHVHYSQHIVLPCINKHKLQSFRNNQQVRVFPWSITDTCIILFFLTDYMPVFDCLKCNNNNHGQWATFEFLHSSKYSTSSFPPCFIEKVQNHDPKTEVQTIQWILFTVTPLEMHCWKLCMKVWSWNDLKYIKLNKFHGQSWCCRDRSLCQTCGWSRPSGRSWSHPACCVSGKPRSDFGSG